MTTLARPRHADNRGGFKAGRRGVAGAVVLGLLLSACTAPEWADPVVWRGGPTTKLERISIDEEVRDPAFPSLGSVPDAPPRPSTQRRRDGLVNTLAIDRQNARYSEAGLSGGGKAVPRSQGGFGAVAYQSDPALQRRASPRPLTRPPPPPGPPPALPPATRSLGTAGTTDTAALPPVAPPAPEAVAVPDPKAGRQPAGPIPLRLGPSEETAEPVELVGVIYFLDGSSQLDRRDRRVLRDIVLLQQQRGGTLRVVGHASGRALQPDPVAHSLAKFARSFERANNVAVAMLDLGADGNALEVVAAADSRPAYDESQPTGAAGNRRVEIFLEY